MQIVAGEPLVCSFVGWCYLHGVVGVCIRSLTGLLVGWLVSNVGLCIQRWFRGWCARKHVQQLRLNIMASLRRTRLPEVTLSSVRQCTVSVRWWLPAQHSICVLVEERWETRPRGI